MTPNTEPKPATDAEIARLLSALRKYPDDDSPADSDIADTGITPRILIARIEQEREMRRELARVLKSAIGHCDCADYNNKALFPCTDDRPCAGCYMTSTADALLSRAAKMEADYGK